MNIIVNGEPQTAVDGLTVAGLLENMGLADKRLAVEVNREIIPRSLHREHRLAEGDQVEVVLAIGGG
ncbi:MAG TPA: sulfur carrier protein ThiS [Gammaproteobacteria bacterium]|nr:sulfur carrier protein ThiS [Gammaproteobacteria bacterium]